MSFLIRILVRLGALIAFLAVFYGIAHLMPDDAESVVGFIALAVIAVGVFVWGMADGRSHELGEGLRDWLVIAFVVAVVWWVSLVLYEGATNVIEQLRLQFTGVLTTIAIIFVPAAFGVVLGHVARPQNGAPAEEVSD